MSQMDNLRVTKSNELITNRFNFTLNEYRIFLYGVSLINPLDKEFPIEYEIELKTFAKMFSCDINGLYKDLKDDVLDRMFMRFMTTKDESGKWKERIHLVRKISYCDSESRIKIKFDEEIKPYVQQLSGHFTSYYLYQIAQFKSSYSIRFYEWCAMEIKKREGKPTQFFISIQDIKEYLLLEKKYKKYSDLKKRVVQKAFDEINAFSDLSVRYEEIKKGRSVYQLKITVKYKKWEKKEEQFTFPFDPNLKLNE